MNYQQVLFILCGEAFSGKSTLATQLAEKYDAIILGRDTIMFALEDTHLFSQTPIEDDDQMWEDLWPTAVQGVKNQLLQGRSVVFDDTVLYFQQREELRLLAQEIGAHSVLIYLNIPHDILTQRRANNKKTGERHDVYSASLLEDSKEFERPAANEKHIIYTTETDMSDLFTAIAHA